jgi:ABC-type transport system involved in cytochrome c biogenesis permease subunit
MSTDTAEQTEIHPDTESTERESKGAERTAGVPMWRRMLRPLASLELTVFLFVLAFILIFCGTLAQVDAGIWTVLNRYFRTWGIAWIPLEVFVRFGQVFFGVSNSTHLSGSIPFPGGGIIGALLLANLLAAHAIRFRLSWRRAGILVLHTGLVVMMLGEFFTWHFAIEGHMTIENGQASNYIEESRATELAFVDSSGATTDKVVVVPDAYLKAGGTIQNDVLPVDIETIRFMPNSAVVSAAQKPPKEPNLATTGIGTDAVAVERPEVSGTDQEQKIDTPSAYITLKDKRTGRPMGTYLASVWLQPQKVAVGDKSYDVSLRLKRSYKPYSIELVKFTHEKFIGTETPKNFASKVRLVDPTRNVDRVEDIYMNNPLRYQGETFYQASFLKGDVGTVLQVVRNPSWLLPYLSCGLVAIGMLLHFGLHLTQFLGKARLPQAVATPAKGVAGRDDPAFWRAPYRSLGFWFPWTVVAAAALYLAGAAWPQGDKSSEMQFQEFAKLPMVDAGRIKPFDTFARNNLMVISSRQEYKDADGKMQPAIKWLLDVMTSGFSENKTPQKEKVFRIENDQVLKLLGLEPRPLFWRYAIDEFGDKVELLEREAERARKIDSKQRDIFDVKILELEQHLGVYLELSRLRSALIVPPESPDDEWSTLFQSVNDTQRTGRENPALRSLATALLAYAKDDPQQFNAEIAKYRKLLDEQMPADTWRADLEVLFNRLAPFYQCSILYVVVFLLACAAWFGFTSPLNRAAFWLAVLTLVVHTAALGTRMYLQGRPPVTNLYSASVFIGWGCLVLALILETIFRNGMGTIVGAVLGGLTMLIAHHLARSGDTLEMMQAVLDTNFWLATHVTCITLGYVATFVAGFFGILFVVLGVFTHKLDKELFKSLSQMIYGVVCFATLLSFTGTVLGGIWADQSWGRFWGWDPKENGALLIVLWNALILHARWGGLVKQRGVALLAIAGNMVTGWSFFGTNQLGVGLHAYGFNNALAMGLTIFWGTQLALLLLGGLIPPRSWASFGDRRSPMADGNGVLPTEA